MPRRVSSLMGGADLSGCRRGAPGVSGLLREPGPRVASVYERPRERNGRALGGGAARAPRGTGWARQPIAEPAHALAAALSPGTGERRPGGPERRAFVG